MRSESAVGKSDNFFFFFLIKLSRGNKNQSIGYTFVVQGKQIPFGKNMIGAYVHVGSKHGSCQCAAHNSGDPQLF